MTVPQNGKRISGNRTLVKAILAQGAIERVWKVLFQYRMPAGTGIWKTIPAANPNHSNPDTSSPWFTHWDVTSMPEGDCDLRAVAYNYCGDPEPYSSFLTVTIDHHHPESKGQTNGEGKPIQVDELSQATGNAPGAGKPDQSVYLRLGIPGAALDAPTSLTIAWVENCGRPDCSIPNKIPLNIYADLNLANNQTLFSEAIRIVFEYPDSDQNGWVDGTDCLETSLWIYYVDSSTGAVTSVPGCVVDPVANIVYADVTHFTVFGLYGAFAPANITDWVFYR